VERNINAMKNVELNQVTEDSHDWKRCVNNKNMAIIIPELRIGSAK
jgi:hypothetical protein